jgi:hypothetical protein
MPFKRTAIVIVLIVVCIAVLTKCINNTDNKSPEKSDSAFSQFAGSEKCATCHKNVYEKHLQTAHHLSSQPATEKTIKGSFDSSKNKYVYNPSLYIAMEKRDSGLFQVVYYKGQERKVLPFDIAIGSGTKGQSFAYWLNNRLFQLPITYYTVADQWSNSPGFPSKVQFDRPITSRCMECHSSYARTVPGAEPEEFNKQELILGVGCEKCHGPGAGHVAFQSQNPNEKKAKYIINPSTFSRQQKLDMCALCHGGNIQKTQPSFSFTAGDKLSDYFISDTVNTTAINFGTADVHGNQYGLLRASKCFRMSEALTCNTCHNTHENERGKLAVFSERCMSCHNTEHNNFCTVKNVPLTSQKENCISCHMPEAASKSIVLFTPGSDIPKAARFRSHFISIYKEEVKQFSLQSKKTAE